jgi:hypothetical protein
MKGIVKNYTFDKTAKTVTFTNYTTVVLERILAVINVTKNIVIYRPDNSAKNGTVSGNVLTLSYDTSTMSNTDKLMILYDDIFAVDKTNNSGPLRPIPVGGKAVNSSTYSPAYNVDDAVAAAFDQTNGGLNVNQGVLLASLDSVQAVPSTSSDPNVTGGSYVRITNANSTAQTVKPSAGNIFEINVVQLDATPQILYLKFYNKTGATSTDIPFWTVPIPSGVGSVYQKGIVLPFNVACSVRCVSGSADNNTGAPATSPIIEIKYA